MASLTSHAHPLDTGFGSFFRYHGPLAPGIRLFRKLNFPAKVAWISLAFCIPIIFLLNQAWHGIRAEVEQVKTEQQGVAYIKPIVKLLNAAEARRRNVASGADAIQHDAVHQAFAELETQHQRLGESFGVTELFKTVQSEHNQLLQAGASTDLDAAVKQHTDLIDNTLALLQSAANGSHLVLSPEMDTNSVIWIAAVRGPQQTASLSALRDLGGMALRLNQLSDSGKNQLLQFKALVESTDQAIEASYTQGIRKFPEVDRLIDMKGADDTRDAFMQAVDRMLLGPQLQGQPSELMQLADTAIAANNQLMEQLMKRLDERLQERLQQGERKLAWSFGLAVLCISVAFYLMLAFYRVMQGGLQEVSGHLAEISRGNLTTAPQPWGSDEAAQLMLTMREMQTTLRRIVGVALESSSNLEIASQEIASGSNDLSRRTEANAASLEETAASMEQISSIIHKTSDTVVEASQVVQQNATVARNAGDVIERVEHTMSDIRLASDKISDIIRVIDGIAFQTNLLALNAAVEAARAGEQGRGFAVVAAEVRGLASRSAKAAQEIQALIQSTVNKVETGHRVVNAATNTIREVVENAGRIDQMIQNIAATTHEQSTGAAQVVAAVQDLDASTQQNAALVEETAAASNALATQAHRLATEISFFKLK